MDMMDHQALVGVDGVVGCPNLLLPSAQPWAGL